MIRLLLLACFLLSAVPSASAQAPDREVFTGEELAERGVVRLNDILRLTGEWDAYFIDDYTWNASAGFPAAPGAPSMTVLVNDQPIDVTVLDHVNLNTLPIHRSQIDSVVVHHTPTTRSGRVLPAGTMAFYTAPPQPGTHYTLDLAMGNEIGDPGPFRFTDRRTINIDRIGPNGTIDVSHGGAAWQGRLSLKGDEHHATDERIRSRLFYHYDPSAGPPRRILRAPRLEVIHRGPASRHRAQASYVRFLDFYRPAPLGNEIPTRLGRSFAAISGTVRVPAALQYRLSYTGAGLYPRENRRSLRFDWHQNRVSGHVSATLPLGEIEPQLGVSTDYRRSQTGSALANAALLTTRLYSQVTLQPARRWRQQASVFVTNTNGDWGLMALTTSRVRHNHHRLHLTLSWTRQPYAAQNSLWYWMQQGYELPGTGQPPVELPAVFTMAQTFTTDAGWRAAVLPDVEVQLTGRVRRFDGLNLAVQQIERDADSDGLSPRTTVRPDVSGTLLRGVFDAQWHVSPAVRSSFSYSFQRAFGGRAFADAHQAAPHHRLSASLRLRPSLRASVYGQLSYRSPSRWPSFAPTSGAAEDQYPGRLPAFWTLDVTAQKRMWQDHLLVRLSLRNVLNEPLRLHPAGAVSNLMLFVGLQVSL